MMRYYARRAAEYERLYARPERQEELAMLRSMVEQACRGRRVLDVACGTGYFTLSAARGARSVLGIDASAETLAIARSKGIANADFAVGDAYALPRPAACYEGAIATFWWSHMPHDRIRTFLRGLRNQLVSGAMVLFADNVYVAGNSTPIARRDAQGNTYQVRTLINGERYEVLKNFPDRDALQTWGEQFGTAVEVRFLTYFWTLQYRSR